MNEILNKTLIIENLTDIENYLSINFYTWLGSECVKVKNAKSAIDVLNSQEVINLIVTKSSCLNEKSAITISEFLKSTGREIPLIIYNDQSEHDFGELSQKFNSVLDIKPVIQASAKFLNITAQDMAKLKVSEYFPIPMIYFNSIKLTPVEVFESLDDIYNTCFSIGANIDPNIIKTKISEGMNSLYVKSEDRLKFVTRLTEEISSNLDLKELSSRDQLLAVENSQNLLRKNMASLGITEETIALSKQNLKNMVGIAKKTPSIKKLLKRLMQNKSGYLYKHTQLLMYVSDHLSKGIDWVNEDQRQKLQFISFFHDISLENDEQARIHSEEDLKRSNLSPEKRELVKKHAQLSAELITKYPKTPMGVEQIIKEHHGEKNGIGFAEHFTANLSPLTIVFVLAEDIVSSMIDDGENFNLANKIIQMREKYSTQRFQKIIDHLETL